MQFNWFSSRKNKGLDDRIAIHALPKTGSTFLFHYFERLSKLLRVKFYSPNGKYPSKEIFINNRHLTGILAPERSYDYLDRGDMRHIIHLRHPIDILVSDYYSKGYLHMVYSEDFKRQREIVQQMTIDEFALDAASKLKSRFAPLLLLNKWEDFIISRYANMVLEFESWNRAILTSLKISDSMHNRMFHRFRRQFEGVDELTLNQMKQGIKRHNRKMLPGDHLAKLQPKTIEYLQAYFKEEIEVVTSFGQPRIHMNND